MEFSHAALPFGWTSSPRIWESVCRVLAAALRRAGIRVLIYVDDFLLALYRAYSDDSFSDSECHVCPENSFCYGKARVLCPANSSAPHGAKS